MVSEEAICQSMSNIGSLCDERALPSAARENVAVILAASSPLIDCRPGRNDAAMSARVEHGDTRPALCISSRLMMRNANERAHLRPERKCVDGSSLNQQQYRSDNEKSPDRPPGAA